MAALVAIAALGASCCPCRKAVKRDHKPLNATQWTLSQIEGQNVAELLVEPNAPTIIFDAEGGVGGQIACYGCVSVGDGTGKGFRLNGSGVQGLFVNCVCIGRQYGFYSESNGGTQVGTLINCSTVNCTTQKSDIYTVITGTPVA